MAAKSESVTARESAWSWSRAREVAVVFGAGLTGVGALLAGLTYTVQPLREDVRILQATMVEVRKRLVRVEEGQAGSRKVRSSLGRVRSGLRGMSAGFSSCSRVGRTASPPLQWQRRLGAPGSRTGGRRDPGALLPDPG